MYRKPIIVIIGVLLFAVVGFIAIREVLAENPGPPSGNGITPIVISGNPTCQSQGYDFGFKPQPEPPPSGTYPFLADPYYTITITSDGTYFNWSSTITIDAVIVKGGNNSNLYQYSPEAGADTLLHSPINDNNGLPYGISHIEFCYDYEVSVTKTANTTFTRTYDWDITKAVDPAEHHLFAGGSASSNYLVQVTKTSFTDSDWAVNGEISIYNPAPGPVLLTSVTDTLTGGISAQVTCPGMAILSRSTLVCTYTTDLPDGTARTNTATVTANPGEFLIDGGTGTASVTFGAPTTEVNATINVNDVFDGGAPDHLGSASDTFIFPVYARQFTCSSDPAAYTDGTYSFTKSNTATIAETGDSASQTVTVYCYAPTVTKDANTSLTRTWNWTINKGVSPASHAMFIGQNADSSYTIAVDKTGYTDSNWAVSGTITVSNPHPTSPMIVSLADVVTSGINASLDCAGTLEIPAGGSATCGYAASLPDGSDRTNTATATLNGASFSGSAAVSFADPTITTVNDTIHVADAFDGGAAVPIGSASDDTTFPSYSRNFACSSDPGAYTNGHYQYTKSNTATITETGQSDSETVTVNCYAPVVSKNAHPYFTRTYQWSILKSSPVSSLTLATGQQQQVSYSVTVSVSGQVDSDFGVSGKITVTNPHPGAAMSVTLSDVISPNIPASLACGGTLNVSAGGSADCNYSASLPDGSSRTNTVTVIFRGIDFTATAPVNFAEADKTEVDECVTVSDDQYGSLGTVCIGQAPQTFNYSLWIGPYNACGDYQYTNTASFVTNDTATAGSSSWTVNVHVPCAGCTLTQGYWKTHSRYGPAPYDDTWAQIGEDTPFFLSGQSWYQVLWTSPAGNAYYNLAHQYIAARLNILNGAASTAEVDAAITWATDFFTNHSPSDTLPKQLRQQVLQKANLLDQYNNGLIGPGHCTE